MAEFYKIKNDLENELNYLKRSWIIRKKLPGKHPLVWVGVDLASYYIDRGDYTTAQSYLDIVKKELGKDTVDNEEISVIYKHKAILDANLGNHSRSLDEFALARRFYERNPFPLDLAKLLMEIGFVQAQSANYETGLKYYFQAFKIANDNHYNRLEAQLNFRIGRAYYFMDQNELTEEFCKKSLEYSTTHHLELDEAMALNQLGLLNIRKKQFAEAQRNFERALFLRRKNNNNLGVAGVLGNMGELYYKMNDLKNAEEYELQALAIAEAANFASGKSYSYLALGQVYLKMKQYEKSMYYLDEGEVFARKIKYNEIRASIYETKKDLWKALSDYPKALLYAEKYETLKDSILNKNVSNRIVSLRHDFELDQKESEIKILNQQKKLQQNEMNLQLKEIRQQRLIIFGGVLLVVILSAGGYVVFSYYRKVAKLNRAVSEQNEEMMAQSEELREANEVLGTLNREIMEKKEEIQAQAEELMESNQTVLRINESLETKIEERTHELKEAYRELDTFFYRSSHDFRRPLTTFMGLAEVAKVTLKDSFALELFNKVNETALSLDKMLHKLQSVSLIGSQELIYTDVFLKEIVQVELDQFRDVFKQKNIDVQVAIEPVRDFYSFPALIKIILQNLIENSTAFCETTAPWIKIEAQQSLNSVAVKVSDNGCGIEATYIPRVYEMYFRASEKSKGNGLGLYIVKKIVDKLKGTIEVQSIYGEGTSVIVTIPNQQ